MKLTPRQRAYLRSLAQRQKAIVQVGKDGVTDTLVKTLGEVFHNRELLKVKVLESAPDDADAIGDALAALLEDVQVVQRIGRTLVLYRRHPERPEIKLPE